LNLVAKKWLKKPKKLSHVSFVKQMLSLRRPEKFLERQRGIAKQKRPSIGPKSFVKNSIHSNLT
jgi:hypothetical protein